MVSPGTLQNPIFAGFTNRLRSGSDVVRRGRQGSDTRAIRIRPSLALVIVAVMLLAGAIGPHENAARPASVGTATPALLTPPPPDWPEFHANPQLTGYTANTTLSTTNASKLGVRWAAELYGAPLDSPVTAYDTTLGLTLTYVGTETGNVLAVNEANGQIVWAKWLGSQVRSVPVVSNGSVYFATFSTPAIYRLNATTGSQVCRLAAPRPIEGTPVLVTPPGGVPTLYVGSNDDPTENGPLLAMNANNCSLEWSFSGFTYQTTGSWDGVSFGVNATGTPLVLFGTADPDSAVYALNARSGALVWRFQVDNPAPGIYDVGAGAVITLPGINGFADGVAYVPSKLGILYALDLTTGTQVWATTFDPNGTVTETGRSTAALDGTTLVLGDSQGLVALDATTGTILWRYHDPTDTEILSSPSIAGASGGEVVVAGDVSGSVDVVALSNGSHLYTYQTGGYITSSPAVSGGNILIASTDGFLYDFGVGGGNAIALPTTSIISPIAGATLPNPGGKLTISGTARDPAGVAAVGVAIESNSPSGPWWDGVDQEWSSGPYTNLATLSAPGTPSTAWSIAYPVPRGGGTYRVMAHAVAASGQTDILGAVVGFSINASTSGPHLKLSSPFAVPGGTLHVTGGGFGRRVKVELTLNGKALTSITSSSTGALPSSLLTIPASTPFGVYAVNGTASGGKTATAPLTVENSWQELGYGGNRTGYEPNDPVLNAHVQIDTQTWMQVAWRFDTGAPVNASPVVAQGVVYVANTAGQLFAVDNENGGLLWEWTLPSHAAILGSPAVDPANGLVLVADADGTLTAVSTANGTPIWSTAVGGTLSAPVFGGAIVCVTSSSGDVECLTETSGAVAWQRSLGGGAVSAPALDTSHNDLLVGEANGNLIALNSTDGATRWDFTAGSAVLGTPIINDRTVYFGTAKGSEFAVSESNGTKLWSYGTGSPLIAAGTVVEKGAGGSPSLAVGAENGTLFLLRASSGKLEASLKWDSPIVGLGSTDGVVVAETAAGAVDATRSYSMFTLWTFSTGASLATAPVIVDGAIYVGGGDGTLYVFTTFGQAPD